MGAGTASARVDRTAALASCCFLLASPPFAAAASGAEPGVMPSRRAETEFALSADPAAPQWKDVEAVVAERDRRGETVAGHRTEIRSRWTPKSLYLLFVSSYEELHLKPEPSTADDTDKLWNWDVAEAFIGSDFQQIRKYKEFQVSPQGEWIDLAIDLDGTPPRYDSAWDSGFEVKARVDAERRVWYGEMRIPIAAIDSRPPKPGLELRINLYRIQGKPPNRRHVNWQPVQADSFHTPQAFGLLRLEE